MKTCLTSPTFYELVQSYWSLFVYFSQVSRGLSKFAKICRGKGVNKKVFHDNKSSDKKTIIFVNFSKPVVLLSVIFAV